METLFRNFAGGAQDFRQELQEIQAGYLPVDVRTDSLPCTKLMLHTFM
jgi:hypothetical protein